ncbi:molybdate ABC transporter permease [Actinobacillus equuli]|nr:molybdate ABC transporter permease [Actinobacillus equuli]
MSYHYRCHIYRLVIISQTILGQKLIKRHCASAACITASGYWLFIIGFDGKKGVIGQYLWQWFEFSFSFSWKGAVLASMVMAFPLMVRSIRLTLDAVDPKLEQAARTLGASPLKVFFTLTLPLSYSGIIAGAVLGFARSLGSLVQQSPLFPIFRIKLKLFRPHCSPLLKHRTVNWLLHVYVPFQLSFP